ncbi:MAG: glycoside hydrolase family 5 protein [Eubacteriales bacterium]
MMYKNEGYMAGANLGHWISQYGSKSHDHFSNYITESDIKRISEWGMDHVRLPVDYFLFEDDANPGFYREDGLIYIDRCIEWCNKYNINLVLDLHHAPGFFFATAIKIVFSTTASCSFVISEYGNSSHIVTFPKNITSFLNCLMNLFCLKAVMHGISYGRKQRRRYIRLTQTVI